MRRKKTAIFVLDFENVNPCLSHNLGAVTHVDNPYTAGINKSSKALRIKTTAGYDFKAVYFEITIPEGRNFGNTYTEIKFQLAAVGDGIYGKPTCIDVSDDGVNWSNTYQGDSSDNLSTAWNERTVDVASLKIDGITGKTGTFFLGVGIRNEEENKEYYLDNIVLVANPEWNCISIPDGCFTVPLDAGTSSSPQTKITEESEGSGVNLPEALPLPKCGLEGWQFAGWAETSVEETDLAPELIPAGAYEISRNLTLYAVYVNAGIYSSNPSCTTSLNGTVVDGWLMVEDFEGSDIDDTYTLYRRYEGTPALVPVAADPAPEGKQGNVIHVTTSNWDQYLELNVPLPGNTTLADYTHIGFDSYKAADNNNEFIIAVDKTPVSNEQGHYDIKANFSSGAAWEPKEFEIELTSGNTFVLRMGYRTGSGDYYLDNIRLKQKPSSSPEVYFRTKSPGSWDDVSIWESSADNINWINASQCPGTEAENVSILHEVDFPSDISLNLKMKSLTVNNSFRINEGAVLEIDEVLFTKTASSVSEIYNAGSVRINEKIQLKAVFDQIDRWMFLGFPFPVNRIIDVDGNELLRGTDYKLGWYDSQKRAESKAGWGYINEEDENIEAGKGYIVKLSNEEIKDMTLLFEMETEGGENYGFFGLSAEQELAYYTSSSGGYECNFGWNFIVQPLSCNMNAELPAGTF